MIKLILILILASLYITPVSYLHRPEYYLVIVLGIVGLLSRFKYITNIAGRELFLFLCLLFFAVVSLIGQYFTDNDVSLRDYMILVRYLIYMLSLIVGVYCGVKIKTSPAIYFTIISFIFVSIVLSFFQYFNVYGINEIMVPIYRQDYVGLITGATNRRIIGTLGNPNYWGLLLGFGFVAYSYNAVVSRNLVSYGLAATLFICIVMTGSRTALISSVIGASYISIVGFRVGNTNNSTNRILVFASVALLITLLFIGYRYFTDSFYANTNRFSTDNTRTLDYRIAHWISFLSKSFDNPHQIFIGRGPSKDHQITWGDNMYLLIFRDFGLISLGIYISLLLTFYRRLKKMLPMLTSPQSTYPIIGILILITFVVFDLAADAWYSVRLVIPLLIGYGYIITRSHSFLNATRNS